MALLVELVGGVRGLVVKERAPQGGKLNEDEGVGVHQNEPLEEYM